MSIFGADVARQVLALGRLDEIIVQIVPVVLGDGCGCSARRRLLKSRWSARTSAGAGRSRTYAFEWAGRRHANPLPQRSTAIAAALESTARRSNASMRRRSAGLSPRNTSSSTCIANLRACSKTLRPLSGLQPRGRGDPLVAAGAWPVLSRADRPTKPSCWDRFPLLSRAPAESLPHGSRGHSEARRARS